MLIRFLFNTRNFFLKYKNVQELRVLIAYFSQIAGAKAPIAPGAKYAPALDMLYQVGKKGSRSIIEYHFL